MKINPQSYEQYKIFPRNGLLSGMIITLLTFVIASFLSFISEDFNNHLRNTITADEKLYFGISIVAMFIHKLESWWQKEWLYCPVYITSCQASWVRDSAGSTIFAVFVSTFLMMLTIIGLIIYQVSWAQILLLVWCAHGIHEIHHFGKSFAIKGYYTATLSGLVFLFSINFGLFPSWYSSMATNSNSYFNLFYIIQPIILVLFFYEHKNWIKNVIRLNSSK